jgi:glycolate oxidase FAD binding subunit
MTPAVPPQDPALRRLIDQVCTARDSRRPLCIRGGSTKAFYGGVPRGDPLDLRSLAGISSHEPTELVVTVRAGTPLAELEAVLGEHGQCLAFEPPRLWGDGDEPAGTVGGMVAAGLAGPARASAGSVRDHVLGATVLNGRGELLTFGGQVMKNVAGYDVSRLMAGSMGVLGVLCEVSLKVLPQPVAQLTIEHELDAAQALAWWSARRAQPWPMTASSWHQGRLRVRLAGARAAVRSAGQQLGGRAIDANEAAAWWRAVRDQREAFFVIDDAALAGGWCLWRLSLPATAPMLDLPGTPFIEWGGAQRWYRSSAPAASVRASAARAGGHATLYRAADKSAGAMAALSAPLMRIHRELKAAFDPAGVFNPGRLYADL